MTLVWFWFNHMQSILLVLAWGLYCPLPSPDYAVGIQPGRVYLPEAYSTSAIVCARFRLLLAFSSSSNLSTLEACNLGRLWTGKVLMYPFAEHLRQCQRSMWLHLVSKLLLFVFFIELYHSHIHEYAKCTWDVHYIYNIEHRVSKLEKHVTTSQFRYKPFYYLWVLRFFDIRRETQSFYSGFLICAPASTCGTLHKGLHEQAKVNPLVRFPVLN